MLLTSLTMRPCRVLLALSMVLVLPTTGQAGPVKLAAARAGHAARPPRSPVDKAKALLLGIERGVQKVTEDTTLTFSALDTYGGQLQMAVSKNSMTGDSSAHQAQVEASVQELRRLENQLRKRYSEELGHLKAYAEKASVQLNALQVERGELQGKLESCRNVRHGSGVAGPETAELITRLKAENEQLKTTNAALQVRTTTPVPTAIQSGDAFPQEVSDLKTQVSSLEADKKALVQTVQHLMKTNQTQELTQELQKDAEMKVQLNKKISDEERTFKAQLQTASQRSNDIKEVAQALQEQNADIVKSNAQIKTELKELQKANAGLTADKNHLVGTIRDVLRQNTKYAQELAEADLTRRGPPPSSPQAHVVVAAPPEKPLYQTATMNQAVAIDRYITRNAAESSGASEETEAESAQRRARWREPALARPPAPTAPKSRLSQWLSSRGPPGPSDPPAGIAGDALSLDASSPVDALAPPGARVEAEKRKAENGPGIFGDFDAVSKLLGQAEAAVKDANPQF